MSEIEQELSGLQNEQVCVIALLYAETERIGA